MNQALAQIRYWIALCLSVFLAVLAVLMGGMGGPQGDMLSKMIGWTAIGLILILPLAIWLTRKQKAGSLLQYLALLLAVLTGAWFASVPTFS